ncbi:MAG: hypothetical protein Q8R90_00630 [Bacteroidales bacterium]|nr:hypothetical protein [Bacteroidales bacterium]
MLTKLKIILTLIMLTISMFSFAQNQNQEKKDPIKIAAEQADKLQLDLKLEYHQHFLVDSVLQKNISGVMREFENMQRSGMQNPESYREVQLKWVKKTEDAFEKILTPSQFERYLKISGVSSKERKKREKRK